MNDGIDWRKVGSGGRFEKIVSVLLSTLYPDSLRIDGTGGDGGRDHQMLSDDSLDVWQCKYFLGRLSDTGGRHRQITDSLLRVANLQPDSWCLVTPMDPTPEELHWFNDLRDRFPFPLTWKGGAWLDANLANHPSIIRHFMAEEEEYVALLRELKEEREALVDGLPAGIARLESLAARINDSNPFYFLDLTFDGDEVSNASLRPKYRGAEKDSPMTLKFTAAFDADVQDQGSIQQFMDALDWGEAATVQAVDIEMTMPHGLGGKFESGEVLFGPARDEIDDSLRLVAKSPEGAQLAALPIRMQSRHRGRRGTTISGTDFTGMVTVTVRVDFQNSTMNVAISHKLVPGLLPGAVLPVLRFVRHSTSPNHMVLWLNGAQLGETFEFPTLEPNVDELVSVIERLDSVQLAAGEAFHVPDEWSAEDVRQLSIAVRLVRGERVKLSDGPIYIVPTSFEKWLGDLDGSSRFSFALVPKQTYAVKVAGHEMDLGEYTVYIHKAFIDPESPTVIVEGEQKIQIFPDEGYCVEIGLGRLSESPGLPAIQT